MLVINKSNVVNYETKYKVRLTRETFFVVTYSQHDKGGKIRIISNIHTTLKNAVKDIIQLAFHSYMIEYHLEDCQESPEYYRDSGGYRQFIYECTQPPTLESSIQWIVERIDITNVDTAIKSLTNQFENLDDCFDTDWSMTITKTTVNV